MPPSCQKGSPTPCYFLKPLENVRSQADTNRTASSYSLCLCGGTAVRDAGCWRQRWPAHWLMSSSYGAHSVNTNQWKLLLSICPYKYKFQSGALFKGGGNTGLVKLRYLDQIHMLLKSVQLLASLSNMEVKTYFYSLIRRNSRKENLYKLCECNHISVNLCTKRMYVEQN